MNPKAQAIKNRLSLRQPQAASLEILEKLTDILTFQKNVDLAGELAKVQALYPTCSDFERDFPSICFSLATGVGKTRLMGAFIAYLYSVKKIRNFFVLAPNLTIYNKLIDDLSNPRSPKYVFWGISDFALVSPRIVTADNYFEFRQQEFKESANINIFNISKINSEMRKGKDPKIKRLSEYLGESYFNYLSELPDLVLLMDESHHYRADAGLRAINELKPVLGLELTATPIDTKGAKFKNVVFDYPLARALQDGFVKEPAVATRRNFDPEQYRNNPKELDLIKLEDGLRLHEDTKVALDIYSRDTKNRLVKPFVLVIARDTEHAKEIRSMIESARFFDGAYIGKVMEIHSNQRGEEKEENVQKLLDLEKPGNPIEIVIHVNMLKEGWDVTNLYTIIPLRAANSQILTEQTIGRGLRLPYGTRTGVKNVDKLTIIAHDRFQAIIDAANNPNSIIRKENIIEIDPDGLPPAQEVLVVRSMIEENLEQKRKENLVIANETDRQKADLLLQADQWITKTLPNLKDGVKNINDLKKEETRKLVFEKMIVSLESDPQQNLFKTAIVEAAEKEYELIVSDWVEKIIPIPRIMIQQKNGVKAGFNDFNLDVSNLNYLPVSEEIVRRTLQSNEDEIFQGKNSGMVRDAPENILINELINFPEVDYDRESELLYKLVRQAIDKLGNGKSDAELKNIILYRKREISDYIYVQLQQNFYLESSGFEEPVIYPFCKIKKHNLSKHTADNVYLYTETITPTNAIPSKIFGGFKKSCHPQYKFDSKAEKDFSIILENDADVLKWMRPADSQFDLYWDHNSKRYHPDFVVETTDTIFMIEVKAETNLDNSEVLKKADTGKQYCTVVTEFNLKNGGKKWNYVLIPHTAVLFNMSFKKIIDNLK